MAATAPLPTIFAAMAVDGAAGAGGAGAGEETLETAVRAAGLVQDRKYGLVFSKTYPSCLLGHEVVSWMVATSRAATREEAIAVGRTLVDEGVLHHVCDDHHFQVRARCLTILLDAPSPSHTHTHTHTRTHHRHRTPGSSTGSCRTSPPRPSPSA
jgi:hypothetical protein